MIPRLSLGWWFLLVAIALGVLGLVELQAYVDSELALR